MKPVFIIGIIVVGIIGSTAIFTLISADTWQDRRTDLTGVAPPDEISEKIDCMSRGGYWDGACSMEGRTLETPETVFGTCAGTLPCMVLQISEIIDGDTIYADSHKIRLSLTDTPEKGEPGFFEATAFTSMACPVGSTILVDQDDLQPYDQYGRVLGKVFCGHDVINETLLVHGHGSVMTQYCSTSEFAGEDWAQKYGCPTKTTTIEPAEPSKSSISVPSNCDESYPDVCIAPYPPDLDCGGISERNFRVIGDDPHRFDGDKDGIGCEK